MEQPQAQPQAQPQLSAPGVAATRLDAYMRVSRAALAARDGPLTALALRLNDGQLSGLFAPQQLNALVRRPLARPPVVCDV